VGSKIKPQSQKSENLKSEKRVEVQEAFFYLYACRNVPKKGIKKGISPKRNSILGGNSKRGRRRVIPLRFLQKREFL
jgi:hypothetical protein